MIVDPAEGLAAMDALRSHFRATGIDEGMIGSIHAAAAAATGDAAATIELIGEAQATLHRAGSDNGLPDLLLAPTILAWRRGDLDRARRWLSAIRHAGRPTQNFPLTAMFRQVRNGSGSTIPRLHNRRGDLRRGPCLAPYAPTGFLKAASSLTSSAQAPRPSGRDLPNPL